MAYRSTTIRVHWKELVAAILVTAVVGAVLVSGLNVRTVAQSVVERLKTFDLPVPKPPPPPPPKPMPKPTKKPPGAPARKAEPSPVAAPRPKIQLPARPAPTVAGTGSATSSGAGSSGTGTGAGGPGSGAGSGAPMAPARLIRNLSRSDYRRLTAGRSSAGSAAVAIRVDSGGRIDSCRVIHSSGDSVIDAGLCPLIASRLLFQPARNAAGQPIPYFTNYLATWSRR